MGRGIYWSDNAGRCGPKTLGPIGVKYLDCSSFVWRVYRDSGATSSNCWSTTTIVQDKGLVRIATDTKSGQQVAKPGDIIIYSRRDSKGNFIHDKNSHAAIYAGNNDVYQMRDGGPKLSPNAAWDKHINPIYGVYRAK